MMSGKVIEAIGDWERAPYCLHSRKSLAILPWSVMSEPQIHEARLRAILYADEDLMAFLRTARSLDLPQWRFVSGGIYQTVWNHLTDTPRGTGIKDFDLIYFDDSDLGWEAEDAVIKRAETVFGDRWPVEVRNQARVHLWYEQRFGAPYTRLRSADESLERYASTPHAIGVRLLENDDFDMVAPFGLRDIFDMVVRPNRFLPSAATHEAKAARAKAIWPRLTVIPWDQPNAASSPGSA
jgi:uncharacterized protein